MVKFSETLLRTFLSNVGIKKPNKERNSELFSFADLESNKALVLGAVQYKKDLVHQLVGSLQVCENSFKIESLNLPSNVIEVFQKIQPVHVFLHNDITEKSITDLHTQILHQYERHEDDNYYLLLEKSIVKQLRFILWLTKQPFLVQEWTAESLLNLCVKEACHLTVLKIIGGLSYVSESEIQVLIQDNVCVMDNFLSYLTLTRLVKFLYKCFHKLNFITFEETEKSFKLISQVDLGLQVMEDMFALCFLRREDILFEETASESGESEHFVDSKQVLHKKNSVSNTSSPNHTSCHTSGIIPEKSGISLGFLCKNPEKVQILLQFMKKHLNTWEGKNQFNTSLRCQKLDQNVTVGLWKLQLLFDGGNNSDQTSIGINNIDGIIVVKESWIANFSPSIKKWHHPFIKNRRSKKIYRIKQSSSHDPFTMNRLLAEPKSLLIISMINNKLCASCQVADLYQLWESNEGRELRYSLMHQTVIEEFQQIALNRSEISVSNSVNDADNIIKEGLYNVAIPSAIEGVILTLRNSAHNWSQSAAVADCTMLTDFGFSLSLSLDHWVQILSFIMQHIETEGCNNEPWLYFGCCVRYVVNFPKSFSDGEIFPLRTSFSLCVEQLNIEILRLEELDRIIHRTYGTLTVNDCSVVEKIILTIMEILPSFTDDRAVSYLIQVSCYILILKSHLFADFQDRCLVDLLNQDLSALIMENVNSHPTNIELLEASCLILGIELPPFLAAFLCGYGNHLENYIDFCNLNNVKSLADYLLSKCSFLANVTRVHLSVNSAIQFPEQHDPIFVLDIYQRFLMRQQYSLQEDCLCEQMSMPVECLGNFNNKPLETNDDSIFIERAVKDLGSLILKPLPFDMISQLEHLRSSPSLVLEQLIMNGQIGAASDVLQALRACEHDQLNEFSVCEILTRYAAKALVLFLPDATTISYIEKDDVLKRKASPFVIPSVAPPKEKWVADNSVIVCPCCLATRFSMFNRRHHCRRCGRVVCASCSLNRQLIESYGNVAVRTCNDCVNGSLLNNSVSFPVTMDEKQMQWILSLDLAHNDIVRQEFSYEHTPQLALALAIVNLADDKEEIANFLLNQCSLLLALLHRHLLNGVSFEVDAIMILQLIKSLILTAKMKFSQNISTPSKPKTTRGLARADSLLSQIDLLSLLASANCLSLLSTQPLSQLDTWRKLRDRLVERELWSLALDVSTKAGLDADSVWAAWGLICLKAGNFQGARQRFQRCLKCGKMSPLLQEILTVLESLHTSQNGSIFSSKRCRKYSTSNAANSVWDKPELIISSVSRLNDIRNGRFISSNKGKVLEEILFYLENYASRDAKFVYLIEHMGHVSGAVYQFFAKISEFTSDVFNYGLLIPSLKTARLEDLIFEMKRHDAGFLIWKNFLLGAAQFLEAKNFWNSLYQFYCLCHDYIRASLVAIRKLYLWELFSIETFISRSELLEEAQAHLNKYLSSPPSQPMDKEKQLPLWWPLAEVHSLKNTIKLQLEVTELVDNFYRNGRLTNDLLRSIKIESQIQSSSPDRVDQIPSLLASQQDRCLTAILVTVAGSADFVALELSWRICVDQQIRLDRYFRSACVIFLRQSQVNAVICLIEFFKSRMIPGLTGYFEMDDMLVGCTSQSQENNASVRNQDLELIIQQIKQPPAKVQAYIKLGWLKAAYLAAVRSGDVTQVLQVQQEAQQLQQSAVLSLCKKWLISKNLRPL